MKQEKKAFSSREMQNDIAAVLKRLEEKVDRLLSSQEEAKTAKRARRRHYQEAKAMREAGKIRLPEFHVLCKRDGGREDSSSEE